MRLHLICLILFVMFLSNCLKNRLLELLLDLKMRLGETLSSGSSIGRRNLYLRTRARLEIGLYSLFLEIDFLLNLVLLYFENHFALGLFCILRGLFAPNCFGLREKLFFARLGLLELPFLVGSCSSFALYLLVG